ncbi:MAG: ECF transporter S component [Clostridia bacterium]|nr:ECF transporter S component [Clostridia bacterium]
MKKSDIKALAVTSVLAAAGFLLTFICSFRVSFLTFDFKDAVIALASLIYGPIYGVAASATVAFLEFITFSQTGVYGLIMNFLASGTFSLVCGYIYKHKRTFSGAILSLVFAAVSVITVMITANIFITPFYMGVERSAVIKMILPLLLPFNAAKTVINASFTMLLYKPFTNALKRMNIIKSGGNSSFSLRTVIMSVVCVILIVLAILGVTLGLNGVFEIF